MPRESYNISCVMRSGGDFNWDDVRRIKSQLDEHLTLDFKLIVLSDEMMPVDLIDQGCFLICLRHNWPGWWSKIELFHSLSETLYLDLDTVIVGNINHLVSYPHRFSALRGFYGRPFGSGLMAWDGDYKFIYEEFKFMHPETTMHYYKLKRWGDQEYIGARIKKPLIFQDQFPEQILSYKIHLRGKELPKKTRIICFHGKPRPIEVNEPWLNLKKSEKISSEEQSLFSA